MRYLKNVLSPGEIEDLKREFGSYVKITVDLGLEQLVIGCELHADGEKILLEKGAIQNDIWGGGINFITKEIDTTAVLNLRPSLDNNSLEIIDPDRRNKFLSIAKKIFTNLWQI
ncbi:MAG: DUF5674 family protein [Patescibacteria group bacterium]|jgi:hypothetical protein